MTNNPLYIPIFEAACLLAEIDPETIIADDEAYRLAYADARKAADTAVLRANPRCDDWLLDDDDRTIDDLPEVRALASVVQDYRESTAQVRIRLQERADEILDAARAGTLGLLGCRQLGEDLNYIQAHELVLISCDLTSRPDSFVRIVSGDALVVWRSVHAIRGEVVSLAAAPKTGEKTTSVTIQNARKIFVEILSKDLAVSKGEALRQLRARNVFVSQNQFIKTVWPQARADLGLPAKAKAGRKKSKTLIE